MDKNEVVLQLVLKVMENHSPSFPVVQETKTEENCKENAKVRGNILAELYNAVYDGIKG